MNHTFNAVSPDTAILRQVLDWDDFVGVNIDIGAVHDPGTRLDLFRRGIPHRQNFQLEDQIPAAKRIVAVDGQGLVIQPGDDELARLEFLAVIPDDVLPVYDEIWTRLLAA